MPQTSNTAAGTANQATVTSATPASDHLTVTVSGPPQHVKDALTNMAFQQPVTPLLCQQIALSETFVAGAQVSDELGNLNMISPESRTAYTERCALDLKGQTGFSIDPTQLPQNPDTTVQQVAEAMFDATT